MQFSDLSETNMSILNGLGFWEITTERFRNAICVICILFLVKQSTFNIFLLFCYCLTEMLVTGISISPLSLWIWLLKEHVHIEEIYSVNKPSEHNFYLTHISKRISYANVLYREYSLNTTIQSNTVKRYLAGGSTLQTHLSFVKVFYDLLIQILFQVSIGLWTLELCWHDLGGTLFIWPLRIKTH